MTNDTDIPTIDPEIEPEYVGAHSALVAAECQNWTGDTRASVAQCGAPATHTVVMWDGTTLAQLAMCDDCGEPDEVATDREWSGEHVDDAE